MIKFVVIVILVPLVIIGGLGFAMIYLVKSTNKRRKIPTSLDKSVLTSKIGTCAKCGEVRILVKEQDTLCAFCYSSLYTKKIGE